MNTVQLTVAMDKITYDTYFLGVLPCDYLPKTPLKDLPAMVIFNTDPSTEPGQHWLAYTSTRTALVVFSIALAEDLKIHLFQRSSRIF